MMKKVSKNIFPKFTYYVNSYAGVKMRKLNMYVSICPEIIIKKTSYIIFISINKLDNITTLRY